MKSAVGLINMLLDDELPPDLNGLNGKVVGAKLALVLSADDFPSQAEHQKLVALLVGAQSSFSELDGAKNFRRNINEALEHVRSLQLDDGPPET
ncbi:hypothetical protein HOF40_02130 [Candidatus Parcubacteria bacterium]|nr:hypothetical protein [Candidatus Parcubacteria bacterium]MBT3948863.1 hypothetical protein [Candidatus Parcubacteria bacterium]